MRLSFLRYSRIATLAMFLGVVAFPEPTFAEDSKWRALVNEYSLLTKQGQTERALEVARKALGLAETVPDEDQKNVVLSLSMLGSSYVNHAQYDKALPFFERALAIKEKIPGPEHYDTATIVNNLGKR